MKIITFERVTFNEGTLGEINLNFHVFTIENENSYDQSAFVQKIDEREMAEVLVSSV